MYEDRTARLDCLLHELDASLEVPTQVFKGGIKHIDYFTFELL